MFLEALVVSVVEIIGVMGFKKIRQLNELSHLHNHHPHDKKLPVLHNLTSKIVGIPTPTERFLADKTVNSVRQIVMTTSFTHVVTACYSKTSMIRKSLKGKGPTVLDFLKK